MQLVIDVNIIIAMLLKPGKPIDLFFREELGFFAPELLLNELERNMHEVQHRSRLASGEIEQLLSILRQKIVFVPEEEFLDQGALAEKVCPDPKDVPYFALALHLQCPIWTNEQKLKEQQHIQIYATHDLIKLFGMDS